VKYFHRFKVHAIKENILIQTNKIKETGMLKF